MEKPCRKCSNTTTCCGCPSYTEWLKVKTKKEKMIENLKSHNFRGISSPEDIKLKNKDYQIQSLIYEIEDLLNKQHPGLIHKDHIWLSVNGERYSKEVRDIVCELYKEKGWSNVTHQTSSENGERSGLTAFKFYW